MTIDFIQIARTAGHSDVAGKFNLPATQECANGLASAAVSQLPAWKPGDAPVEVTITGPAPVWAWLVIAHALHGHVAKLTYAAPNTPGIVIFAHGA